MVDLGKPRRRTSTELHRRRQAGITRTTRASTSTDNQQTGNEPFHQKDAAKRCVPLIVPRDQPRAAVFRQQPGPAIFRSSPGHMPDNEKRCHVLSAPGPSKSKIILKTAPQRHRPEQAAKFAKTFAETHVAAKSSRANGNPRSRPSRYPVILQNSGPTNFPRSEERNMKRLTLLLTTIALTAPFPLLAQINDTVDDGKLRIICFGAHPDDAEYKSGGTAALWAKRGHHVKLVSVTNGDIGHWQMSGGALAKRRTAESAEVAKRLEVTSQVLDIHDGELLPTLENRRTITRLIREWNADIVISHRPWDYHPDHRYVGVLVQDAAFMVTVPFFCPDTPHLKKNPVFLYSSDRFKKPYPFEADIAVAIDDVFEQKVDALLALESQTFEGGALGSAEKMANAPPASQPELRRSWLRERWDRRSSSEARRFRQALNRWYGADRGANVKYAEAFEICEYGRQPTSAEVRKLFPFFDTQE